MNALDFFQQQYEQQNKKNDWLSATRQQAWNYFLQQGLPTLRQESWKYTNVQPLFRQPLTALAPQTDIDWSAVIKNNQIENFSGYRIVVIDGKFNAAESHLPTNIQNALFIPLSLINGDVQQQGQSQAQTAQAKEIIAKIMAAADSLNKKHPFAALNVALEQDGFFLWVKPNTKLDKPIEILHINFGLQANAFIQSQQIIMIDKNATAEIVERFISHDAAKYILNSRCDILLEENAKLTHCRIESESAQTAHFRFISIAQQKHSHLDSFALDLGGQMIRTDFITRLLAPQATCMLNGLYITNGKQHVDNHTLIEHASHHCSSRQFYKGIIAGSSRAVFNGKVIVEKDAQATDAAQQNKNLLLSSTAEIDTKPELEIYADEVKCAHGSTVGQLDEEAIFYLRSRGIPEAQARSLMTFAFAEEMLEKLSNKEMALHAKNLVLAKLPEGKVVREYFL